MADREIAAKVAEALGWTLSESDYPVNFWLGVDGLHTGYCDQPWPANAYEEYGSAPGLFSGKGVWRPDTDIAAAFLAVDWMTGQRWVVNLECLPLVPKPLWFVSFCYYMDGESNRKRGYAEGEHLPLAICCAVLNAMDITH